jgi:hypothetical protein
LTPGKVLVIPRISRMLSIRSAPGSLRRQPGGPAPREEGADPPCLRQDFTG